MKRTLLHRTGAASLSLLYFLTNCALVGATERNVFEERHRAQQLAALASNPGRPFFASPAPLNFRPSALPALPELLNRLPASLGSVRTVSSAGSDGSIVYVQDVHRNEEAQRRIGGAVRNLIDGGVTLVALEGASGPIDLSPFREGPFTASARRAADGLLADGKISGAAYGAIVASREARVVGVEDPALYDANVNAVQNAAAVEKDAHRRLAERRRNLDAAKAATFSPALSTFDAAIQMYRRNNAGLGAYAEAVAAGSSDIPLNVAHFLKAARLERQMSPERADLERRELLARLTPRLTSTAAASLLSDGIAYRAGQIAPATFYRRFIAAVEAARIPMSDYPALNDFIGYVLLADTIDAAALSDQLAAMENRRYAALATTADEKRLVAEDERLHLDERLVDFALTATEWMRYRTLDASQEWLKPFEAFYEIANQRNVALARNLRSAMNENHVERAILVTGGFHETGVRRALGNRIAVATFVPRVETAELGSTPSVISVFCREKEPLDRLFAGEKLFLATPPLSIEARTGGEVMTAADALRRGIRIDQARPWLSRTSGYSIRSWNNAPASAGLRLARAGRLLSVMVPFDRSARPRWPHEIYRPRSIGLNSTVVLAPLLTLAAYGVAAAFGWHLGWGAVAGVYLIAKLTLPASVVWHEGGHLKADYQTYRQSVMTIYRLMMKSILHFQDEEKLSFWGIHLRFTQAWLAGRDITNAYVESNKKKKKDVQRIAAAGFRANAQLLIFGLVVIGGGWLALSLHLPLAPGWIMLVGFVISLTNLFLLIANRFWGTDFKALKTGVRPDRYQSPSTSADAGSPGERGDLPQGIRVDLENTDLENLSGTVETLVSGIVRRTERQLSGNPIPRSFAPLVRTLLSDVMQDAQRKGVNVVLVRASVTPEYQIVVEVLDADGSAAAFNIEGWMLGARREGGWHVESGPRADGAPGRRVILTFPVDAYPPLTSLTTDGPQLFQLSAKMSRKAVVGLEGEIRTLAQAVARDRRPLPQEVTRRLASYLWLTADDPTLFSEIFNLAFRPHRDNRVAAFTEQLVAISRDETLPDRLRRTAVWALSQIPEKTPGSNAALSGLQRWNYTSLENHPLSGDAHTVVNRPYVGTTNVEVRRPTGTWSRILLAVSQFAPWLLSPPAEDNAATFQFSPVAFDEAPLDNAGWTGAVRLDIEEEKETLTPAMFNAVMDEWARVAPVGASLLIDPPAFASSSEWQEALTDRGFELTHISADRQTHHFIKTQNATPQRPRLTVSSVFRDVSVGSVIFVVARVLEVVLIVPFYLRNVLLVRPEAFHRVGAWIEGVSYRTTPSLLAIQFGLVPWKEAKTEFEEPQGRMIRRPKQAWKRDFKTLAEPLGYLLSALAFTTAFAVMGGGSLFTGDPMASGPWMLALSAWLAVEVCLNWIAVAAHLIRPHSDFWLWYHDRGKDPNAGSQTFEEYLRTMRRSVFSDVGVRLQALPAALRDWFLRRVGRYPVNDIAREILVAARESRDPSTAVLRSAETRIRRLESLTGAEVPVEVIEELHQAEWQAYRRRIDSPSSPLLGSYPRRSDGQPLADHELRPFFTDDGWRALQLFRARAATDEELSRLPAGLLTRTGPVSFRLSVAALRPDLIPAFFVMTGKAGAVVATSNDDVLDTEAQPWRSTGDADRRRGSIQSDLGARSDEEASRILRGEIARHLRVVATGRLLGLVTVRLSVPDETAIFRRLLSDDLRSPETTTDTLKLDIIRKHYPFAVRHSVFADPWAAIRGIENAAGTTALPGGLIVRNSGIKSQPGPIIAARDGQYGAFAELLPPPAPALPAAGLRAPNARSANETSVSPDGSAGPAAVSAPLPTNAQPGSPSIDGSQGPAAPATPSRIDDAAHRSMTQTPGRRATEMAPAPQTPSVGNQRPTKVPVTPAVPPIAPPQSPWINSGSVANNANAASIAARSNRPALTPTDTAIVPAGIQSHAPAATAVVALGAASRADGPSADTPASRARLSALSPATSVGTGAIRQPEETRLDQSAALAAVARAEASAADAERARRAALTPDHNVAEAAAGAGRFASPIFRGLSSLASPTVAIRTVAVVVGASLALGLWSAAAVSLHAPLNIAAGFAFVSGVSLLSGLVLRRADVAAPLNRLSELLLQPVVARLAVVALALSLAASAQAALPSALPSSVGTTAVSGGANSFTSYPTTRASGSFLTSVEAPRMLSAEVSATGSSPSFHLTGTDLASRVAAVTTVDVLLAFMTAPQPAGTTTRSPAQAARDIAEGRLTDVERAALTTLARATRQASRLALAQAVHRAAQRPMEQTTPSENEPTESAEEARAAHDIRAVALTLSSQKDASNPAFLPDAERNAALSHGISEGRALIVLEEGWAREFLRQPADDRTAARNHDVPVLLLPSSHRASAHQPDASTAATADDKEGQRGLSAEPASPAVPAEPSELPSANSRNRERRPAADHSEENSVSGFLATSGDGFLIAHGPIETAAARNARRLTSVVSASIDGGEALSAPASGPDARHGISSTIWEGDGSPANPRRLFSVPLPPQENLSGKGPVADLIRTSLVWTAVGFGAVATLLGLDIRHVLALSLTVVGAVVVAAAVRAVKRSFSAQGDAATVDQPVGDGTLPLIDEELERIADLIIQFSSHPDLIRTPDGALRFAALLPAIGALGVADRRLLSRVSGLTPDEAERLSGILAARRKAGAFVPTLDVFEARALMGTLASASATSDDLRRAIGNKDALYPVRSRENDALKKELRGVNRLLAFVGDGQKLYLTVESGPQADFVRNQYRAEIAAGRIELLPRTSAVVERRADADVLSLSSLSEALSALGEAKVRNIIVLLPEGMGWDETGVPAGSPLDWVGFVLLRDFIAGVPVARAGLANLGRLAQTLSTQA